MGQQKNYQIEFYIGLYSLDDLQDTYSFKEAVDKISELIGDCTIIPCVGSYKHQIGIRINMNSLKVVKFVNDKPNEFINSCVFKLKEIFKQDYIITNITECNELEFS